MVLALLFSQLGFAQSSSANAIRITKNSKCDVHTQVELQKNVLSKSASEVRLIAKVNKHFNPADFASRHIVVGAKAGNIVTLRVPIQELAFVQQNSGIEQYTIAPTVHAEVNHTRFDTRTDSVHDGLGLPQGYTGKDVIIGITDWGFDYKHPNFNNNGESNRRLLQAWDQFKLKGPAPEGFDYGTVYTNRSELLKGQCDTSNIYNYATHGSHVAGICAGRGVEDNYQGQAPFANLLFATFQLNGAAWMDAVEWMKGVAKQEGKRLVINNSWGMYTLGPIDGTSLVSQAINNWSDSGIVFVVSAGNCGNDNFHIAKTFTPGTSDTLRSLAKYYNHSQENGLNIPFWGEPNKSFKFSFAMVHGTDSACFRWISTADGDNYIDSALVCGNDTLTFRITIENANIFNQRPHVLLNVDKNTKYEVHVAATANEGTVHGWNLTRLNNEAGNMGGEFTQGRSLRYTKGDNAYSIGEPACADKCIAVAAHVADGNITLGQLANFSSKGPIIDGRRKPEISAPGVNVISSLSSYTSEVYTTVYNFEYANRTYRWARMSGTSMSCPAVTGIVALILEANPQLSSQHVKDIICRTARNDENTGNLIANDSISDAWGWGKVDALAAVNEALAHVDIQQADEQWFAKSLQLYPNPATDQVTVLTGRHTPEMVTIYNINGTKVMECQVVMQATINIAQLPQGVYVVKCGARAARLVH